MINAREAWRYGLTPALFLERAQAIFGRCWIEVPANQYVPVKTPKKPYRVLAVSETEKDSICQLYESGVSTADISDRLGIPKQRIYRVYAERRVHTGYQKAHHG